MEQRAEDNLDIDERRLLAALSYIGVLVLVPLLVGKADPFIRWHVKQGVVLLGGLILSLVAAAWVASLGAMLFLLVALVDIIGVVQALAGKSWRIPGVSFVADKFRI